MFWWLHNHGGQVDADEFEGTELNDFVLVRQGTGTISGGVGRDLLMLDGTADDYRFTREGTGVRVERLHGEELSIFVSDFEQVLFVETEDLRPFGVKTESQPISDFVVDAEPINTQPAAVDDSGFSATLGEPLLIPVSTLLANDTDGDGDVLFIEAVEQGENGTAVLDGDFIRLTAAAAGIATFTYVVSDGSASDRATVSVSVHQPASDPTNAAPVAVDDGGYSAVAGSVTEIPVAELLANDTDPDGDTLTITGISGAENGSAVLDGDVVRFTADAAGEGGFSYTLSDGEATAEASVAIDIEGAAGANQAPTAEDDGQFEVGAGETIEMTVADLLANDSDPDNDTLTVTDVFGAANGSVVLDGDIIRFTADQAGVAGYSYTVSDGDLTDTAKVSISVDIGETQVSDGGGDTGTQTDTGGETPTGDGTMDGNHGHMDSSMMAEHTAVLELVSDAKATHVAVNDGDWFDPATWDGGQVPGEGAAVVIGEGVSVTYGGIADVALATLRVDGALTFASNMDSRIEVETMVVNSMGRLQAGTAESPIPAMYNVDIVIDTSGGPIDRIEDPMQIGRGLVALGEVEMHGAEKTVYTTVDVDAMQGDTSLTLSEIPDGWKAGDSIVLTGTHYVEVNHNYQGSQDEEFTILAIEGNVVTLDRPLAYDHDTPREDLKAYVANYTRNISIETENPDGLPANERGHVMFMHSDDVDIRFVEFLELGRTDKSIPVDNYLRDTTQKGAPYILDENGDLQEGAQDNIVARYAVHVHRSGAEDGSGDPAYFYGNAVFGSPGWGYVNHDSYVVFEQNAAYNVTGSAYVTETGNEIGSIIGNISIRNDGNVDDPVRTGAKDGQSTFDLGFGGHGFWLQGRVVAVDNNISAGSADNAFQYFHRSKPTGSSWEDWLIPADLLDHEAIAAGETSVGINVAPIVSFSGNEAFASYGGLEVVKNNPKQGHDMGTKMDSFLAWDVEIGASLEYTAHYTLTDFDLVGAAGTQYTKGLILKQESMDIFIVNSNVEGFDENYFISNPYSPNNPLFGLDNDGYFFINDMIMTQEEYVQARQNDPTLPEDMNEYYKNTIFNWSFPEDIDPDSPGVENPITISFRNPADVDLNAPVTFELSESSDLVASYGQESWISYVNIEGVKTDSLGEVSLPNSIESYGLTLYGVQNTLDKAGWYEAADGTRFTVYEFHVFDRITDASTKVYVPIVLEGGWNYSNSEFKGNAEISESGGIAIRMDADDSQTTGDVPVETDPGPAADPLDQVIDSDSVNHSALDPYQDWQDRDASWSWQNSDTPFYFFDDGLLA